MTLNLLEEDQRYLKLRNYCNNGLKAFLNYRIKKTIDLIKRWVICWI